MIKSYHDRWYCSIQYYAAIFNIAQLCLYINHMIFPWVILANTMYMIFMENSMWPNYTYFLYGLHAAIIFKFSHRTSGLPAIDLSHIISLISPIASVVFASSKNSTVYICSPYSFMFFRASVSAVVTFRIMSSFVVPPCTYYILRFELQASLCNTFYSNRSSN